MSETGLSTRPTPQTTAQELVYPTTLHVRGPWLLETNHLLALDGILERFCGPDIAPDTEPDTRGLLQGGIGRPHDYRSRRLLTIYLSDDRELSTSSFREAMGNIQFQSEAVKGFEYVATTANATASIRLPKKPIKKDNEENWFLAVNVSARPASVGYGVFLELRDWTDSIKSPVWHQWLLFEPRILYRIGLGFALILLFASLFKGAPTAAEYKETLKQQARDLLRDGINPQNQAKALELVLALQSDYIPPGTKPQQARKPIAWIVIAVYAFAFLSFTPSVCLGIWAGKRRLSWWKRWMKFNTVTIPTLILAHWIYPQMFSTLDVLLRR